ncbi:MAG: DNA-binding protein YbiB [Burkholderiaceae bacterium]
MGISQYIKEIGRGARGAKPLSRAQAADLFGQVLDGLVTDLEIGAFCLAMRIKGETPDEMCGFLDALHTRSAHLPASPRPVVVLPSYNGARKLPVLTPLLALLVARAGLPVLLHGMRTEARRVLASDVLQVLGVPAWAEGAPLRALQPGEVVHLHTAQIAPGLARLLAVREVVGLRNPGHSVVKLLAPCAGPSLLVTSYTHPEYFDMLCRTCAQWGLNALLSRGLEGEVAADPRRTPRYDAFVGGVADTWQDQQPGTASEVPGLPSAIDVDSTAAYTRAVLDGTQPVPEAIARQVAYILRLAGQIPATRPLASAA